MNGSEEWEKGEIMSTQPKSFGNCSHWLNIKSEAENKNAICFIWDHVD